MVVIGLQYLRPPIHWVTEGIVIPLTIFIVSISLCLPLYPGVIAARMRLAKDGATGSLGQSIRCRPGRLPRANAWHSLSPIPCPLSPSKRLRPSPPVQRTPPPPVQAVSRGESCLIDPGVHYCSRFRDRNRYLEKFVSDVVQVASKTRPTTDKLIAEVRDIFADKLLLTMRLAISKYKPIQVRMAGSKGPPCAWSGAPDAVPVGGHFPRFYGARCTSSNASVPALRDGSHSKLSIIFVRGLLP